MYRLWHAPGTAALAVHIALEEGGLPHALRRVDLAAGEQRGEGFRALNPKGRVPVLETPRGKLTEVPAILGYLAMAHPEARLMPADPFDFARAQAFNGYLASTVHVNHAHGPRAARWADDPAAQAAMRARVPHTMGESMALIARSMLAGPWVMGESWTACDGYLFTMCRWLEKDGVDIADHPAIAAHFEAMSARPAVRAALAHH